MYRWKSLRLIAQTKISCLTQFFPDLEAMVKRLDEEVVQSMRTDGSDAAQPGSVPMSVDSEVNATGLGSDDVGNDRTESNVVDLENEAEDEQGHEIEEDNTGDGHAPENAGVELVNPAENDEPGEVTAVDES